MRFPKLGLCRAETMQEEEDRSLQLDALFRDQDAVINRLQPSGSAELQLSFDGNSMVTIKSVKDVILGFLRFMLSELKSRLQLVTGFTKSQVTEIVQHRSIMALSIPSTWNSQMSNTFRSIVELAGYPRSTIIVSEAKAAALSGISALRSSIEQAQGGGAKRRALETLRHSGFLVLDTGHGTHDQALVKLVDEASSCLEVGELEPSKGSYNCTGFSLDGMISKTLFELMGDDAGPIAQEIGAKSPALRNIIARGFNAAKKDFNEGEPWFQIPCVLPQSFPTKDFGNGLKLKGTVVEVSSACVSKVTDDWLARLFHALLIPATATEKKYQTYQIILAGGGTRMPYIRRKIERFCTNIIVNSFRAADIPSMAAEGSLLTLRDSAFTNSEVALVGYGFEQAVPYSSLDDQHVSRYDEAQSAIGWYRDHDEELPDRAIWWSKIGGRKRTCVRISLLHTEGGVDEIVLKHTLVYTHDRAVNLHSGVHNAFDLIEQGKAFNAGRIHMKISASERKLQETNFANGAWAVEIQYRIIAKFEDEQLSVQMVVPQNGKFLNPTKLKDHRPNPKFSEVFKLHVIPNVSKWNDDEVRGTVGDEVEVEKSEEED